MFSLNLAMVIGRCGKPPEARRLQNGETVVSTSVATSNGWKDKNTGERKERTEWHNVVIWNQHWGEQVERFLRKGDLVCFSGEMQTRKWQDQSGNDRYTSELVLTKFGGNVVFLTSLKDRGEEDGRDPAQDEPRGKQTVTSGKANSPIDDDIPF